MYIFYIIKTLSSGESIVWRDTSGMEDSSQTSTPNDASGAPLDINAFGSGGPATMFMDSAAIATRMQDRRRHAVSEQIKLKKLVKGLELAGYDQDAINAIFAGDMLDPSMKADLITAGAKYFADNNIKVEADFD